MFVRQSTYNALHRDYFIKKMKYEALLIKWNDMVDKINARGGQSFLDEPPKTQVLEQLSQDEIKTLIRLCHPDKHGGKDSAVKITQKLLDLRK